MTAEEKEKFNALVDKVGNISERIELLSRKIDTAIASVPKEKIYHYLEELPTEWEAREVIENLYKNGIYRGNGPDDLNLSETMLRVLVILYRLGLFS